MTRRIIVAYGRVAVIRSCDLRILLADTISSAEVTFLVFSILRILVVISFPLAMSRSR